MIVVGAMVATSCTAGQSQPNEPSDFVSETTVIPAGQRSMTATVTADLAGQGLDGIARPFTGYFELSGAALPAANGTPTAAASIDASVRVDGGNPVAPGDIPAAGNCDGARCRATYVLDFALAQPAQTDVVVWWLLRITGTPDMWESWPDLDVAVDVDVGVPFDLPGAQRVASTTSAVRLDRVGDGTTRVDYVNGAAEEAVVEVPGSRVVVPAGASSPIPAFTGCDRPTCTVHVRIGAPIDGMLIVDGPVVTTDIAAGQPSPVDAPSIRSEPVERLMQVGALESGFPASLGVVVDGNDASGIRSSIGEEQITVRVRMRLVEATPDAVVRYQPSDVAEPIVLSAAAGLGNTQETTVDLGRSATIDLERISGNALVRVWVEAIVAYPDGVPDGAAVFTQVGP